MIPIKAGTHPVTTLPMFLRTSLPSNLNTGKLFCRRYIFFIHIVIQIYTKLQSH